MTVRKAVIPAAGLGTRFLPITKVIPKELLPIGTKPTLQIVIEELIDSGITEVIIINSEHKTQLKSFFELNNYYTDILKAQKKEALLDNLTSLISKIKFTWVIQDKPKGLGHAILCAKQAVANEPFVIALPDVLIESKIPGSKQLIDIYNKTGHAINATEHSPRNKLHLYGIYDIKESKGKLHKAKAVIEKPKTIDAPSDLSVVGRYLFPPEVFEILENTAPGHGGEIQLADAMNTLAKQERMFAYEYEGRQFDTGDQFGFLKANIYYGSKEFNTEIKEFIKEL